MSSIGLLWQNCATASQSLQLSCLLFTNIVKNSFTDWFTCSICPSACRWYAVEGFPYFSTDFPSFLGNGQCFESINLITGSLALITPAPFENLNLATSRKGELDSTLLGEHGEYILCPFLFFQHLRKQCMVLLFELIITLFHCWSSNCRHNAQQDILTLDTADCSLSIPPLTPTTCSSTESSSVANTISSTSEAAGGECLHACFLSWSLNFLFKVLALSRDTLAVPLLSSAGDASLFFPFDLVLGGRDWLVTVWCWAMAFSVCFIVLWDLQDMVVVVNSPVLQPHVLHVTYTMLYDLNLRIANTHST